MQRALKKGGAVGPAGSVSMTVNRAPGDSSSWWSLVKAGLPRRRLAEGVWGWKARNFVRRLAVPLIQLAILNVLTALRILPRNMLRAHGALYATVRRVDGSVEDYGLVSLKVVTTAGVTKIVDFLRANDVTTGQNFKFHGVGTGSTAEAIGDTALVTELTTQYNPDNTRPTGTQTNNGATVYRTVATVTPDSGFPIVLREHGVFSANTAGTLLDRSVFGAITINASGDSITPTYDLTVAAGG